jgi:hypothetical protein
LLRQLELLIGVEDCLWEVDAQSVQGFSEGFGEDAFAIPSDAEDLRDPRKQGTGWDLLENREQGIIDFLRLHIIIRHNEDLG